MQSGRCNSELQWLHLQVSAQASQPNLDHRETLSVCLPDGRELLVFCLIIINKISDPKCNPLFGRCRRDVKDHPHLLTKLLLRPLVPNSSKVTQKNANGPSTHILYQDQPATTISIFVCPTQAMSWRKQPSPLAINHSDLRTISLECAAAQIDQQWHQTGSGSG